MRRKLISSLKLLFSVPVRAVVTDGITLGRPCCAQHNCTKALVNNRFRFCEEHQDKLGNLCAVEGCNERRVSKSLMCSETEHQEWESRYNSGKKAWFQLRARLAQAGVPQLLDSLPDDAGPSDIGMSSETDPSHKLDEGNVQIKVRLARRRTHNEQLVVCCCGVIAARGTMYGAEAVSGVKVRVSILLSCRVITKCDLQYLGFPQIRVSIRCKPTSERHILR